MRLLGSVELSFPETAKRLFPLVLLAAYGVFLCSYFVFPDYSDPYRFFAKFVFLPGLFVMFASLREIRREPLFLATLAYLAYLLLSGLWSDPLDWYRLGQKCTIAAYLLAFIAVTHFLIRWNSNLYRRVLQLSVLIAAVAALVSLLYFYRDNPFPGTRLMGIGSLTNVNEFSNVYGVFALLAMGFALRTPALSHKLPFLLAVEVFLCFAWFGQSRTAFASLVLALIALVFLMLRQRKLLYALVLVALAGSLAIIFPDLAKLAVLRGEGLRPQIWSGIWDAAVTAPVFGHGLIVDISLDADGLHFETAHNAFLQAFWHGGVIGLCLMVLLLVIALRTAWSRGRELGEYTVFCLLLFAACTMMTGVDTLIDRPRDQWLLFWFPLALLLGYPGTERRLRLA
ncbi:MAG: O-antigen ligase family protein [Halioglobus sp.]